MKTIVLNGPLLAQSGYSTHTRQIARWLLNLEKQYPNDLTVEFKITPWGMTPYHLDPNACDGLIGKIMSKIGRRDVYDVAISVILPNEVNPFLGQKNILVTAGVETDKCNPQWVDAINKLDLVVVPSEHIKKTFHNTGDVKVPIEVIPESWFEECRTASVENNVLLDKLKLDADFNFLVVSQFTGNNPENDRKNIAYTLKWLIEEFKDEPNVGVLVKTNFGRNTEIDKKMVSGILSQILLECKRGPGPKVQLLHGHMTDKEMASLYTHPKVKALVNLTRAEGFGLPILEAATCGLPVIATDWSAHPEFLNKGKWVKVDYSMVDVHASRVDNQIFMQGSKWANPMEEDFKRKARRFYKSSAIPRDWAKDLKVKLLEQYSPEAIEKIYTDKLKDIIFG
jgi:glycosyltransferase involved in cell wall biosynthesis